MLELAIRTTGELASCRCGEPWKVELALYLLKHHGCLIPLVIPKPPYGNLWFDPRPAQPCERNSKSTILGLPRSGCPAEAWLILMRQPSVSGDLKWLVGKRLLNVTKQDHTWSFAFDDGDWVCTESCWRLVTVDGLCVASGDHGHVFGLISPIDAAERAEVAVGSKKIRSVRVADRTSDLIIEFEDGIFLEFLSLSCGYESWHARHGSDDVICMGGGHLATCSHEKKG